MSNEIGIDASQRIVRIGESSHPIILGKVEPFKEFEIRNFSFLGEKGSVASGCIMEVIPHGATGVIQISGENVRIQEIAVKGSGWFLGISPDGETVLQEVGENNTENPLIEFRAGWTCVWIAGEEGLEVLDVTEPPFDPSMEIAFEPSDERVPASFWQAYDRLKTQS